MPSVRAMSAIRPAETTHSSASDVPPVIALAATIAPANSVSTTGFAAIPRRRPNRRSKRPRQHDEEADARDVHDGGVAGQEPGKVRGVRVLRRGAIEDQEVRELAAQRREDLVGEDQRHEPGREQPPNRWPARPIVSCRPETVGCRSGVGQAELRSVLPPGAQTSPTNAACASAVASSRSSVRPSQVTSSRTEQAADDRPDREARHDPREAGLDPGDVEEPARLPADEHEAELDQDREEHQQRHRHPGGVAARGDEPGDTEPNRGRTEHGQGDAHEVEALRRAGDGAGHDDPGRPDGDVRGREPGRAVRVEEHRVGDDAEQRGHRAEHEGLARQPGRSPACNAGHAGVVSASGCARSRTIATSAPMIPFASSGRSASSSSRTGRSIRSRVAGPSAVTDAERGSGTSAASSPTVRPGTELDDGSLAPVHAQSAPDHGKHVLLDRALGDDDRALGDLDLGRPLRDGREGPAGNVGEQADAVERHDALDGRHRHPSPRPAGAAACASSSARHRPEPGPGIELARDHDHVDLAARRRSRCSARRGGSRRSSRRAPRVGVATARSRRRAGREAGTGRDVHERRRRPRRDEDLARLDRRAAGLGKRGRAIQPGRLHAVLGHQPEQLVGLGPGAIERLGQRRSGVALRAPPLACRRPWRACRASVGSRSATSAATSSAKSGRSPGVRAGSGSRRWRGSAPAGRPRSNGR